jgi:hypothetical protein
MPLKILRMRTRACVISRISEQLGNIFNILFQTHTLFLSLPAHNLLGRSFGRKHVTLVGVGFLRKYKR